MKTRLALITATVGIMLIGSPVSAHHSFAGTYLEDATPVTVEGTLVAFLVRNPHSFVHVEDASRLTAVAAGDDLDVVVLLDFDPYRFDRSFSC